MNFPAAHMRAFLTVVASLLSVAWVANVGAAELRPGFPINHFPAPGVTGPLPNVEDFDGDGDLEIFTHNGLGGVAIYHHDGSLYTGFSLILTPATYVYGRTQIYSGDLDADGVPDLVIEGAPVDVPGVSPPIHGVRHTAVNADGSIKPGWPVIPDAGPSTWYRLGDLDGDGGKELIVFPAPELHTVWAYHSNGQLVAGWPVTIPWVVPEPSNIFYGGFAIADVDFDGAQEVILTLHAYIGNNLQPSPAVVINGDGTIREGWPDYPAPTAGVQHDPIVVDLDGRGQPEIVFFGGGGAGGVSIFDSAGGLVYELGGQDSWPVIPLSGIIYNGNAVGDLEGDGMVEILTSGFSQLRRIKPVSPLPPMQLQPDVLATTIPGYSHWRGLAIADVDGDGPAEIAAWSLSYNGAPEAALHLLDMNLNERPGWPVHFGALHTPLGGVWHVVFADLDNNGELELIHMYDHQLFVWNLPRTGPGPVRIEWGNIDGDSSGTRDYHSRAPHIRRFIRADADASGQLNVADAVTIAQHIFLSTPHPCPAQLDVNADDHLNLLDVFALVQYLFLAGPPPASNYPQCAAIPIGTNLACEGDHCP